MGMLLGSTVYVFSIILAVFLVGLAVGSAAGASLARSLAGRAPRPPGARLVPAPARRSASPGPRYMIADSLPYWPINPFLATSHWFIFQLDMARCLWAILPPTLLWGASFPLALAAAAAARSKIPARLVGGIYAANTLGAIVGALGVSLALVPWIGTQNTERCCSSSPPPSALWCCWRRMCAKRQVASRWPPSLAAGGGGCRLANSTPIPPAS